VAGGSPGRAGVTNALAELHEELERHVTTLLLSRAHREVRATLDHDGATRRIGAE
jgi:hypothetical protein